MDCCEFGPVNCARRKVHPAPAVAAHTSAPAVAAHTSAYVYILHPAAIVLHTAPGERPVLMLGATTIMTANVDCARAFANTARKYADALVQCEAERAGDAA
jgi:hypothetical protein